MKVISSHRGGVIRGWFIVALVFLIVLAVTGWFVARSDGFRDWASERLTMEFGLPVAVTESYIGWPYQLVLRGVVTPDDAIVRMNFREIRVGRSLRRWSVHVHGARVAFMPQVTEDITNSVSPHIVRVARLRDAGALDIMHATEAFQSNWKLYLDDIDLYWLSEDEGVQGLIRQLDFVLEPVELPENKMYYYHLSYVGAAENAMGSIRDLTWSWLTHGGDHYVELYRDGVTPEVSLEP